MKHLKLFEDVEEYENKRQIGKTKFDQVISPIVEMMKQKVKELDKDSIFDISTEDIFMDKIDIDEDGWDDQFFIQLESDEPFPISNYRFNVNLEEYRITVWVYCYSREFDATDLENNRIERHGTELERYNFRYEKDMKKKEGFRKVVEELGKNFKLDHIRENPMTEPSIRISYYIKDFLDMRQDFFKNINEE